MITVIIRYKGKNSSAKMFARDMIGSGTVKKIREEEGNIGYEYFTPYEDPETILFIDSRESQDVIDKHHKSPMMEIIASLREKYDLHMTVEKYEPVKDYTDIEFVRELKK